MMGFCFDDFYYTSDSAALCKKDHALLIFLMSSLFTMMITDQLLNHYMLSKILDKWRIVLYWH